MLIISTFVYGQKNQKIEPWQIGCDTLDQTQLEMNICSYESFKLADSVLTKLHSELTQYFDSNLENEKNLINSSLDTIQIEYVNLLDRQITELKKSINNFYKYRENTLEVIKLEYDGGSMQPLATNSYALALTVNRIKIMRIMIDELTK